jgi:hypothetical protein
MPLSGCCVDADRATRPLPTLKRVRQRDFLAQRRDAPISFAAGQIVLKQLRLVRLDREVRKVAACPRLMGADRRSGNLS